MRTDALLGRIDVIACLPSKSWHAAIGSVLSLRDEVRGTLNVHSWRNQTFGMALENGRKVPLPVNRDARLEKEFIAHSDGRN